MKNKLVTFKKGRSAAILTGVELIYYFIESIKRLAVEPHLFLLHLLCRLQETAY